MDVNLHHVARTRQAIHQITRRVHLLDPLSRWQVVRFQQLPARPGSCGRPPPSYPAHRCGSMKPYALLLLAPAPASASMALAVSSKGVQHTCGHPRNHSNPSASAHYTSSLIAFAVFLLKRRLSTQVRHGARSDCRQPSGRTNSQLIQHVIGGKNRIVHAQDAKSSSCRLQAPFYNLVLKRLNNLLAHHLRPLSTGRSVTHTTGRRPPSVASTETSTHGQHHNRAAVGKGLRLPRWAAHLTNIVRRRGTSRPHAPAGR